MITQKEKNIFEGFLWKFFSDRKNLIDLPTKKGTEIFLEAKEKFPEKLRIFSKRAGDGKCIALQELIDHSVSIGDLKTSTTPAGGYYSIWNLSGPHFIISPQLYFNNSAEQNYQNNIQVIDYLFELYKKQEPKRF